VGLGERRGSKWRKSVLDRVCLPRERLPCSVELEVQNALRNAERRKRIDVFGRAEAWLNCARWACQTQLPPPLGREVELARKYDLTVYDISYLDLALRAALSWRRWIEPWATVAYRLGVLADESLPVVK